MTQLNLDILCVNTQSALGLQGAALVNCIKSGDLSAQAFVANHFALHGHMKAIMDYDMDSENLTDEQLFIAEENIIRLIADCARWV